MKLRVLLAAAALVFGASSGALAGPIPGGPPSFTIDASSSVGGDSLHLTPTLTPGANGSYSVSGTESTTSFSLLFDFALNPDPSVSGSFTLTNLSGVQQTFSVSATLGVLPIAGPTRIGGFYGDATYKDANNDSSVELSSAVFYRAQIDGAGVRDLGSFPLPGLAVSGGPGVFGTISQESFGAPIPSDVGPGVVGSIGVAFPGFTLTPGDSVEVPFEFVVSAPEPAVAPLLLEGGFALIFILRARRKFFQRARALW